MFSASETILRKRIYIAPLLMYLTLKAHSWRLTWSNPVGESTMLSIPIVC